MPLAAQMPAKAQVSDSHETNYVWKIDLIWEGSSTLRRRICAPGGLAWEVGASGWRWQAWGLLYSHLFLPWSVSICFIYLGAAVLGAYMLMGVILSLF